MAVFEGLVREHGITVVLVTHEPDIANYADRLIRMRDGRIVDDARKGALQPVPELVATA